MALARILIWNVFDSKTSVAELREHLRELPYGDAWIVNEAADRFGLVSFSDDLPDVGFVRELLGKEPDVYEEYDVLEP
jgi:hypothetical protein